MEAKPTVHIIDDELSVRRSLGLLLLAEGFAVRTHESADDALADRAALSSGCIVTDVRMPGLSGLDLIAALRSAGIASPVIVMTGHADVGLAVSAMKAGALDFIEKPFEPEALVELVASALRTAAPPDDTQEVKRRFAQLSNRERQVFFRLVEGDTSKMIANTLDLSPRTVEIYRGKVMLKMQAGSLSDIVRMALKSGLA
ncbi:MAG: response regulator [Caulobacteraceae bacterium]|nr:response regulator [Caulobacter sp.]